jgi:ABC-type multidrug transport system fused ATPase/permease subunit
MKTLKKFMGAYKKETVLAPLFKLLEACFELFVPLVVVRMIDQGIKKDNMAVIWQSGGLMLLLAIVGLACSITAQFFAAKAATGAATAMRRAMFEKLQKFSFTEIDEVGTGTMITRMTSDINQVQSGINMVLRLFLRSPFIVFGAMAMAFTIDVEAAVVFAVIIPVLSVVVFAILLSTIPGYRKVQGMLDQVLGRTRENLTGGRVIRAFRKEQDEIEGFRKENKTLRKLQEAVGRVSALLNPLTYVGINIALVVLIHQGSLRVQVGALTTGEVVALINYMSQILVELIKLANLIILVTKAIACMNRVSEVLEKELTVEKEKTLAESSESSDAYVEYRHVNFAYEGAGDLALEDISFQVKKGELIGIIGGTGAGKSTLMQLLCGFYPVTEGTVFLDGKPVDTYETNALLDKVGIVMQKPVLFRGSILENLRMGKQDATQEECWKALEIAQAKDFVEEKQFQLMFRVQQGGKNLSGGQRQRLSLARTLIKKPEVLILDDSASALDYLTDVNLRKAIRESAADQTVFIISQRTASIMDADKILVLDDGKLIAQGTHQELLDTCETYQEIYYSQFPKEGSHEADK